MLKSNSSALSFMLRKGLIIFSFFLVSSLFFWQCISPPDYLGGDLLPSQDLVRVKTDTSFQLSAFTQNYDSINTAYFITAVLGETYDPVFGRTKAQFFTQLALTKAGFSFGANPTIDSAFIYISLADKLGDEPINIGVYELADSLQQRKSYNGIGNIDRFLGGTEIASLVAPYNGEEKLLKIPINHSWIQEKLFLASQNDTNIFGSQINFQKHLYGMCVKATNTFASYAKGMYLFDYNNTSSKLSVFYKNDKERENTKNTNLTFSLFFTEELARFNHFEHDLSAADPSLAMSFSPNENTQDSVFYIKGLGAARGKIELKDIQQWVDLMPVAINRAELRLELEEHQNMPADSLLRSIVFYTEKDDVRANLLDLAINQDVFDGQYKKSKKYYSFNITHYLQTLLNDPDGEPVFYVEPGYAYANPYGAVIRSWNNSQRMKLIITYTKF
ncbi:MAG: DUF4270 family protein [Tenuifilaceae bacterium]|nr:DUF4270 family protein [Tenuifilaceae bacterium]